MSEVSLREYLERLIDEKDGRYEQRFKAAEIALSKAEAALFEYKQGSNEWRDALKDSAQRMATRAELEKLDEAVQELRRAKANLDGRLMIMSGGVSAFTALAVWALSRLLP